jgi:hypothetical protein
VSSGAERAGEAVGDYAQQTVAGVVAERVVHLFEAAQVHQRGTVVHGPTSPFEVSG